MQVRSPAELTRVIPYTHSAGTTVQVPIVINSHVWIPVNTAGANALNAFMYRAELSECAKATGETWAIGDLLYWDAAAAKLTKTSTSNTKFGYALATQASGDTVSGLVLFDAFAQ